MSHEISDKKRFVNKETILRPNSLEITKSDRYGLYMLCFVSHSNYDGYIACKWQSKNNTSLNLNRFEVSFKYQISYSRREILPYCKAEVPAPGTACTTAFRVWDTPDLSRRWWRNIELALLPGLTNFINAAFPTSPVIIEWSNDCITQLYPWKSSLETFEVVLQWWEVRLHLR